MAVRIPGQSDAEMVADRLERVELTLGEIAALLRRALSLLEQ